MLIVSILMYTSRILTIIVATIIVKISLGTACFQLLLQQEQRLAAGVAVVDDMVVEVIVSFLLLLFLLALLSSLLLSCIELNTYASLLCLFSLQSVGWPVVRPRSHRQHGLHVPRRPVCPDTIVSGDPNSRCRFRVPPPRLHLLPSGARWEATLAGATPAAGEIRHAVSQGRLPPLPLVLLSTDIVSFPYPCPRCLTKTYWRVRNRHTMPVRKDNLVIPPPPPSCLFIPLDTLTFRHKRW